MDAMLKVEVVSRETIKPSKPTPNHKSTFTLTYFDQSLVGLSVEHIFYYSSSGPSTSEKLLRLKESLSRLLVLFYPLAGRLDGEHLVSYNDAGVQFIVTRVVATDMSEALQCGDVDALAGLLPPCAGGIVGENDGLLSIQANVFACGGVALGVLLKVFDGCSLVNMVNSWAAMAAGTWNAVEETTLYEAWKVFPPDPTFVRISQKLDFFGNATIT